jgi:hypothetical protein
MSAEDSEGTPAFPHLSLEFFVWLWYASEREGGSFFLGDELGRIDAWVDDRLAFRTADEDKVRAVMTGENAASTLEARAALAGGKVVADLRLNLRREEREYSVVLKGPHLDLQGAKLPAHQKGGEDELLYERMFLYEDLWFCIGALYRVFAVERASPDWGRGTVPAIRRWVGGAAADAGA